MNGRGGAQAYPGSWLATKLGMEPRELDVKRRAGEILGLRTANGRDYLYPVWQLDENGRPHPSIARVVQAARAAGLDDETLHDLLQRRDGMTGRGRLLDGLLAGREDRVLEAIRSTAQRESRS